MFTPKRSSKLRKAAALLSVAAATALVVGTTTGAIAMAEGDSEGVAVTEVADHSAPQQAADELSTVEPEPVAEELAPIEPAADHSAPEQAADELSPVAPEPVAEELAPVEPADVEPAAVLFDSSAEPLNEVATAIPQTRSAIEDEATISPLDAPPHTNGGAIFTTDATGTAINKNIYESEDDVWLNGGPDVHNDDFVDGTYFVKVTTPGGKLLGSGSIKITAGNFHYQLSAIVSHDGAPGYADTTNNGGEYKLWVSSDPAFPHSETKTDNFKVSRATVPPNDDTTTTVPPNNDTTTTAPPNNDTTTTAPPNNDTTTTAPPNNDTTTTAPPNNDTTTTAPPNNDTTTTAPPNNDTTTTAPPTMTPRPCRRSTRQRPPCRRSTNW